MSSKTKGTIFFWFTFVGAAYLALIFVSPLFTPPPHHRRPPFPVQREQQRKLVRERVEAAGGWEVLRKECERLITVGSRDFIWEPPHHATVVPDPIHTPSVRYETNIDYGTLPTILASLRPRKVTAYGLPEQPTVTYLEFFGAHTTGARGIADYGLLMVSSNAPAGFTPEPQYLDHTLRKITDLVFEEYEEHEH